MNRADALESELATLRATAAEARALARGVAALLGVSYTDALTRRYLENRPWQEVTDLMGCH